MINARSLVLDILKEVDKDEEYSNILITQVLDKYDYLEMQDKAFIKRLTEGTIERQITLDYVLNQFSKTQVEKMKPLIRCLLRMSVYQLLYMDAIPDSAVCNEAVKLAQKRHFSSLKGFVNGVLRNIARQKEQIIWPNMDSDWKLALSVETSMPEYILEVWEGEYGKEKTVQMAKALLEVRPVCVRVDEGLGQEQKEEILQKWKKAGIYYRESYMPYAFYCSNIEGIRNLPGFLEGQVTVQDVSSMLVAECAGIKEGDYVLDVCAAPGGKSMHAACKTGEKGSVDARDISEYKISLIQENADRMKLSQIHTKIWDAAIEDESLQEKADVLFLDVPCSGLGIIGHKRDIKYHITEENFETLQELQRKIVSASIPYVKKGGVVMYSTCTIHRKENEDMAGWIEENFPLKLESLDPFLPTTLQSDETREGMLQLYPGEHDCDGFFVARFIKE